MGKHIYSQKQILKIIKKILACSYFWKLEILNNKIQITMIKIDSNGDINEQ